MSASELRSVLVVGTGLIGASVGLALRARGIDVYLRDADPEAVAHAVERGAGLPDGERGEVDLAVVAVPPQVAPGVVRALLDEPGIGAVTDVTSVKAPLAAAISVHGDAARYVGGHPMAGREVSGPAGAHYELFRGRPWVICPPVGVVGGSPVELVTQLALLVGATPVRMSPGEHDAAVAVVSHAPHLVAALVAGRLRDADGHEVRLAGGGVRDITRVAASDPAMWREILAANAVAVRDVLRAVRDDLDSAITALDDSAPDLDGVEKLLHAGVAGRGRLPGKHGSQRADFVGVPVELADRPGQLAGLFSDVGEIGINVEDVRIEHVPGEPVGLVELSVRPEAQSTLTDALRLRGWTVHG